MSALWAVLQAPALRAAITGVQAPAVTFKVDVNFVEIPAVVVDRQGGFVDGLRQEDFEIFEDGRRQTIAVFSAVDTSAERPAVPLVATQAIEPDVRTNATPFTGRLYVLLMDDLHVDGPNTAVTRQAARAFVEGQLGPADLAAVVCTSGQTGASQEFTADRQALLSAIDRFMGRSARSATLSRIDDYAITSLRPARVGERDDVGTKTDSGATARLYHANITLTTIRRLSETLAAIRGRRKAVILFSEGLAATISGLTSGGTPDTGTSGDTQRQARDAIAAAIRANVTIYGVSPRGLSLAGGRADMTVPVNASPEREMNVPDMEADIRQSNISLDRLSSETGGFAATNVNNAAGTFDRIREDNSRYYLLGYYPADNRRDGKFHALDVRVRTPGVTVRARVGYVALRSDGPSTATPADTRGPTLSALQDALDSPLPVPGLRMTASTVAFAGTSLSAPVTLVLYVDGRDLEFKPTETRYEGSLALSVVATNPEGVVKNSWTRTVSMPLRPDSYKQVATSGIRFVERLDLPTGRYRIRIAAQDTNSRRVGSVHCDLEVPDFDAMPLAMSGVLLTSSHAGLVPTAPGEHLETLRGLLPGPPSVARIFPKDEVLGLAVQIYDHGSPVHRVDISTTVTGTDGREVFRHVDQRSSAERGTNGAAYQYATRLALTNLTPGLYTLTIEARSTLDPTLSARRDVPFEIVP